VVYNICRFLLLKYQFANCSLLFVMSSMFKTVPSMFLSDISGVFYPSGILYKCSRHFCSFHYCTDISFSILFVISLLHLCLVILYPATPVKKHVSAFSIILICLFSNVYISDSYKRIGVFITV
jgi:hypothetical protein